VRIKIDAIRSSSTDTEYRRVRGDTYSITGIR
jgi:hypothetical protein